MEHTTIGDQILAVVRANPDCTLGEVMQQLPNLDWAEVYLEAERLSRSGQLRQIRDNVPFTTTLRLP